MNLSDPERSRAVLVGSHSYRDLEPLPAVANNLERLKALFTSPDLWGLPQDNCRVVANPAGPADVLDVIHEAASEASDTLLIYYAGHGLVDPYTDDLYLALPESSQARLYNAVRFEDLRREMVNVALAASKVVILDCCYSGRAMLGGMSGSMEMADQARIEGTYLMTASAETVKAQAPVGEEFTAFTNELVTALDQGLPDGPDLLNVETLYWHVRKELVAKRRPTPQQRAGNDGGMIVLARNRRGVRSAGRSDPARPPLPEPPSGSERLMRRPPREIAGEAERLTNLARTDEARQLLTAVAVRRPDQEVAALIAVLRGAGRHPDADLVIQAAARRPPEELIALLDVLLQIGSADDAAHVVDAVAAGSPEDIGATAAAMAAGGRNGELRRLLDAAIAAHRHPDDVIALVGTLLSIGLDHEISRVLDLAAESLSDAETAALADALRAAGRQDAAFRLYGAALGAVAQRPSADLAPLLRAMRDAGRNDEADRLIGQVCAARQAPDEVMKMTMALWSAELESDSGRVLEAAASNLADVQIAALAESLREADRYDSALHLCVKAAELGPVTATVTLVKALRDAGRPVDGYHLLDSTRTWPAQKSADLIILLGESGNDADKDRLLVMASRSGIDQTCDLVVALRNQGADEAVASLIADAESSGVLASALHRRGFTDEAKQFLVGAAGSSDEGFCEVVESLPGNMDQYRNYVLKWESTREIVEVSSRLTAMQLRGMPWDSLLSYVLERPVDDIAKLAEAISNDRREVGSIVLASLAAHTWLLSNMRASGHGQIANKMLEAVAGHMNDGQLQAFVDTLDEEGRDGDIACLLDVALQRRPVSFAASLIISGRRRNRDQLVHVALVTFAARRPAAHVEELVQDLRQAGFARESRQLRKHSRGS